MPQSGTVSVMPAGAPDHSHVAASAAGSASTITVSVAVPAGWNELDAALFN